MSMDEGIGMKFWLALTACLLHSALSASEVSPDDAREAVAGWAALQEALAGGTRFGASAIAGVKTCPGADGKGVFYVVAFEGGGYAIASGDTETEPILGYSAEGEWIDDEVRNPLLAMLKLDVAAMCEAQNGAAKSGARKMLSAASAASGSPAAKRWAKLRAAANATPSRPMLLAASVSTVTDEQISAADLRVGPLLPCRWAQGNVGGAPCYNYCTPLNRVSGCVATMAAQIMYYHRWPQGNVTFGKKNRFGADRWSYGYGSNSGRAQVEIESGTFGYYEVWCSELLDANGERWLNGYQINGYQGTVEQTCETRYSWNLTKWEPAFGGAYDWDDMLDDPQAAAAKGMLTDANRLAIGHLVRDVGLTVPIRYEMGGGEGSAFETLVLSLVDTFQYADAALKVGIDADTFKKGILANLDAKLPVGVIVPGHAIVADGYGYVEDTLYVHFNMGWGAGGAWYRPPVVYDDASLGGSNNKYDSINAIVYNIRPTGEEGASIVSGRVIDKNGNPAPGVTVSAEGGGSCTTDEKGIYVLFLGAGDCTIKAVNGSTVATTNMSVAATTSCYIYKDGTRNEGHEGRATSVGNVWGADLTLVEASETELGWINETADTTGQTGAWSNGIVYDRDTKRAALSGENVFTPLPSGGNTATLEFTAKFDSMSYDLAVMDSDAQMALCIGSNGKFRLWSGGGWVDVSADGITPSADVEYTVRIVFDYRAGRYSASVRDSGGTFKPLRDGDGNGSFAIAADASHVGSVVIRGDCLFASLTGTYYTVSGFSPGDVTGEDAQITLSEAHAAWLNALAENRGYVSVSNGVARLSAARFETAYLCNLDVTRDDFDATFGVTGITVDDEKVAIEVTLERTGAVQSGGKDAPINGVLRFYGAATVEAFRSALSEKTPLADVTLSNGDFAGSETATAEIGRTPDSGDKFFKAEIGEK